MPTRTETKRWRALRRRKGREAAGCFLAEGRHLVAEMVEWAGATVAILCAEGGADDPAVRDLLVRAGAKGVRVETVSAALIASLADAATPQPLLAIGEIPTYTWDDVGPGRVLLLDGVQDPGNLGTLARTAVALGVSAVIGVGETADPWAPKALRASAGAVLRAPVFRTRADEAVLRFRSAKVPIWVAAADGTPLERGSDAPPSLALALGSEAHGVSGPLRAAAERTVSVPLRRGVESLNVAAAGAILLDRLQQD